MMSGFRSNRALSRDLSANDFRDCSSMVVVASNGPLKDGLAIDGRVCVLSALLSEELRIEFSGNGRIVGAGHDHAAVLKNCHLVRLKVKPNEKRVRLHTPQRF